MTNHRLAAGLAVIALATSLTACKDENKRCVDEKTHKVVSSKSCGDPNSDNPPPLGFLWYVGGRGTRVGQTARGGSTRSTGSGNKARRGNSGKNGGKNGGGKNGGGKGGRR